MFNNNPKGNSKKGNSNSNPLRLMSNIPGYNPLGAPVPNRIRAASFGNVPPPPTLMAVPNMDNLHSQIGNPATNRLVTAGFGNVTLPPTLMDVPNMGNLISQNTVNRYEVTRDLDDFDYNTINGNFDDEEQQTVQFEQPPQLEYDPYANDFSLLNMDNENSQINQGVDLNGFLLNMFNETFGYDDNRSQQPFEAAQAPRPAPQVQPRQAAQAPRPAPQVQSRQAVQASRPAPQVQLCQIVQSPEKVQQVQQMLKEKINQQMQQIMNAPHQARPIQQEETVFSHANNILDQQILDQWNAYVDVYSKGFNKYSLRKSLIRELFDYLAIEPVQKPLSNHILMFIELKIYKKSTPISVLTAKKLLGILMEFFGWTCALKIYPNIVRSIENEDIDEIYKANESVHQNHAETINHANLQTIPTKRHYNPLQQPQICELHREVDKFAMHCLINDDRVINAWNEYRNICNFKEKTISNSNTCIAGFLDYLESTTDGIENPQVKHILGYIKSIKPNRNNDRYISFSYAEGILSRIKKYFEFLDEFNIYKNNITNSVNTKDLHIMYGHETSPVRKRRLEFEDVMKNRYSTCKLNPNLISEYVGDYGEGLAAEKQNMLNFRDYLIANRISQPTPNDVTKFIVSNPKDFRCTSSIHLFLTTLREFFRLTSQIKNANNQILYPNIDKFLDPINLVDALLYSIYRAGHSKNSTQDEVKPEDIKILRECLGIDAEGAEENKEDSLD